MKKQDTHVFQGLSRDLHPSKLKGEFLWDALNVRITSRGEDTLLTITNEKGPELLHETNELRVIEFAGTYLGHCILDNNLVVFTKNNYNSFIYLIEEDKTSVYEITYKKLVENNTLDFGSYVEAIGLYGYLEETGSEVGANSVRKVYWVDDKNQPRVINIDNIPDSNDIEKHTFDFVPYLKFEESVDIVKNNTGGKFPSGVILYCFTYYKKYMLESNIFYTSPLYYLSPSDRGGSPEESNSNSFNIRISNPDTSFDFIRVYSIVRTSVDGTSQVRRVVDISLQGVSANETISYLDNGIVGETVDLYYLLYVGGEEIRAKTIESKNNKLFLGNIFLTRRSVFDLIQPVIDANTDLSNNFNIESFLKPYKLNSKTSFSSYNYISLLNNSYMAGFKCGECYRLGVLFLHKTGKWSEPIFVRDCVLTLSPEIYILNEQNAPAGTNGTYISVPTFKLNGNVFGSRKSELEAANYIKVRPVVVFPDFNNREILALAIACPTVYNAEIRANGFPQSQSSWFFRPNTIKEVNNAQVANVGDTTAGIAFTEFRNGRALVAGKSRATEILSATGNWFYDEAATAALGRTPQETFIDPAIKPDYATYIVDLNIITLHSPDIYFDDSFYNIDYSNNYLIMCSGYVKFDNCFSDIDIQTSSAAWGKYAAGFVKNKPKVKTYGGRLCAGFNYNDTFTSNRLVTDENERPVSSNLVDVFGQTITYQNSDTANNRGSFIMTYPWQKTGSISNGAGQNSYSVLSSNKLSNMLLSNATVYYNSNEHSHFLAIKEGPSGVSSEDLYVGTLRSLPVELKYFNLDYIYALKYNDTNVYYGNVDTIATSKNQYGWFYTFGKYDGNYIIKLYNVPTSGNDSNLCEVYFPYLNSKIKFKYSLWVDSVSTNLAVGTDSVTYSANIRTSDPVRIRYKSTPHMVANLGKYQESDNNTLASWITGEDPRQGVGINSFLWLFDIVGKGGRFDSYLTYYEYKLNSEYKLDIWIPAGDAVDIDEDIVWSRGDTWYQRFDCLKTYPFTQEDENSVVEIASYLTETRVNLDGRYDKLRGQISNLMATPENFNRMNMVYSQHDNFFQYNVMDDDMYKNSVFRNQITWTLEHRINAEVDDWTRITLAENYDLDGNKGEIVKLINSNDTLLCFQEKGISQILYNDRMQIPVSDGVPIEISNGTSVLGHKYLTDNIGCNKRETIKKTRAGVYFIDSMNGNLYMFTNEGLSNISLLKGMSNWFNNNGVDRIFVDYKYNDLYIFNPLNLKKPCLVYSEDLQLFVSFMSYNDVSAMFNLNLNFLCLHDEEEPTQVLTLWRMFNGNYNDFFGTSQPFYIEYISNENPLNYKIFTNVEATGDIFTLNQQLWEVYNKMFDFIHVKNEFQDTGKVELTYDDYLDTSAKKKFRVWRFDIPRDSTNILDRISNTWASIRLGVEQSSNLNNKKMHLHSISTTYHIM